MLSVALPRLRSGHNDLKAYKHRLSEEEDPGCRFQCLAIEDATHLLLNCTRFTRERQKLSTLCEKTRIPFDTSTLLGLNPNLDNTIQFKLRNKVCESIFDTKIHLLV